MVKDDKLIILFFIPLLENKKQTKVCSTNTIADWILLIVDWFLYTRKDSSIGVPSGEPSTNK